MSKRLLLQLSACVALAASLSAQPSQQRRATMRSDGRPGRGKCTIEVVVDGVAEVEIRGDTATLRTLAGQPAFWRRFECDTIMPSNPANFRFSGIDGRGRQDMVRDPRGGGPAVVRIEDPKGGSEGYTFDIEWSFGGGGGGGFPGDRGGYPGDRGGSGRRFSTEEAVRVCQEAVREQAFERFRARDVSFRRTALDDNPGRNDWVIGVVAIRHGGGREEDYRFSCSVNFDTGRVRSAQIDERVGGDRGDRGSNRRLIDECQRSVEQRLRRDGFDRIEFEGVNVDNRPGRNDWIVGIARASGRFRQSFDFSCRVNFETGVMLTVDVNRR